MSKIVGVDGKPIVKPKTWEQYLDGRAPTAQLALEYLENNPMEWHLALIAAIKYLNEELEGVHGRLPRRPKPGNPYDAGRRRP